MSEEGREQQTLERDDEAPTAPRRADYEPEGVPHKTGAFATLKRAFKEFSEDNMTDWAAALTYYGLLSLFPALIALVSIVGIFGDPQSTTQKITDIVTQIGPQSAADTFSDPIKTITQDRGAAGVLLIVGILAALWSASGYTGAYMRASNIIWETPEGRPFWKARPLQMLVTLVLIILMLVIGLSIALSGPIVEAVADPLGVGSAAVSVWEIAKWPVLILLFALMLSILNYTAPNVKQRGFKFVTPGSLFAMVVWILASDPVRVLCRQLRLLQQDLRDARRPDLAAGLDVDHQCRDPAGQRAERRDRALKGNGRGGPAG